MYELAERLGVTKDLLERSAESPMLKLAIAVVGTLATMLCSGATWFWGGWLLPIKVLVALMSLDYATGWAAASKHGTLSSDIGKEGVKRKVGQLVLCGVANLLDLLFAYTAEVFGGQVDMPLLRTAVTCFYIGHEGISLVENMQLLNVPIPAILLSALAQTKERGMNDDG